MNKLADYIAAQRRTEQASRDASGVWFSEPEIRLSEALQTRGFSFEQQKRVSRGEGNGHAILDFLVEDVLVVEVDGREFHNASSDRKRDRHMAIKHGYWTLRLPGWKVMNHTDEVVCLVALKFSELHRSSGKAATVASPGEHA